MCVRQTLLDGRKADIYALLLRKRFSSTEFRVLFVPFDSTSDTANIDNIHVWDIVRGDGKLHSLAYLAKEQECKTSEQYEKEFNNACPEFIRPIYQLSGTCSASCEQWWTSFANSEPDSKCYFAYRSQASTLVNAVGLFVNSPMNVYADRDSI